MEINSVDVAIAAVILPPLVALINQRKWPSQLKGLVALLVMCVYALGASWLRGPLDFSDWRNTALTVAAAGFAAYKLWWQPSGIAPAIEEATSADSGGA